MVEVIAETLNILLLAVSQQILIKDETHIALSLLLLLQNLTAQTNHRQLLMLEFPSLIYPQLLQTGNKTHRNINLSLFPYGQFVEVSEQKGEVGYFDDGEVSE